MKGKTDLVDVNLRSYNFGPRSYIFDAQELTTSTPDSLQPRRLTTYNFKSTQLGRGPQDLRRRCAATSFGTLSNPRSYPDTRDAAVAPLNDALTAGSSNELLNRRRIKRAEARAARCLRSVSGDGEQRTDLEERDGVARRRVQGAAARGPVAGLAAVAPRFARRRAVRAPSGVGVRVGRARVEALRLATRQRTLQPHLLLAQDLGSAPGRRSRAVQIWSRASSSSEAGSASPTTTRNRCAAARVGDGRRGAAAPGSSALADNSSTARWGCRPQRGRG
jgi:hypothetical protein